MKALPQFRGSRLAARLSSPPVPRPSGDRTPPVLVAATASPPALAGSFIEQLHVSRRIFWSVYNAWMSQASDLEVERLDNALQDHAPHVRPIHAAISDAMRNPASSMAIPLSLLAALDAAGWAPSEPPPAAADVGTRSLGATAQASRLHAA